MSKKILFCATVDYHFKLFHLPYLKWFKEQGWEVHTAASGSMDLPYVDQQYDLTIHRSPFYPGNYKAYQQLKALIEKEDYELIHCHTPVGGVLSRLAARKVRKRHTQVVYTAHGFHFCKGAPWLNWLLYYPIEKSLSALTDCLITINKEDYALACRKRFRSKHIIHVHGVGVDTDRFKPVSTITRNVRRRLYGFHEDDFLLFYAAEFNGNKNQRLLIEALYHMKHKHSRVKLLLAGTGSMMQQCKRLTVKLGLTKQVYFLGFRDDIEEILPVCDAAVAPSFREGLPVNVLEAMACGLPIIASENRGHKELVMDYENGYIVSPHDSQAFADRIITLETSIELRSKMGINSKERVKAYSLVRVKEELTRLYLSLAKGGQYETSSKHHRAYI